MRSRRKSWKTVRDKPQDGAQIPSIHRDSSPEGGKKPRMAFLLWDKHAGRGFLWQAFQGIARGSGAAHERVAGFCRRRNLPWVR
jgi:hypothetical protein